MVRFLHTADFHLGRDFEQLREWGAVRQEDLRTTFRRTVDLALKKSVDLYLVAGDLFDTLHPAEREVELVREGFEKLVGAGVRVFVIPGNHDPYLPEGVWEKSLAGLSPDVHVFGEPEFRVVDLPELGVSVVGRPYDRDRATDRFLGSFSAEIRQPLSLLLFHGSLEGPGAEYKDHPFSLEELRSLPVDYVALGHYHGYRAVLEQGKPLAYYPGTPEGLQWDERSAGSRYVLYGEMNTDGTVRVEPIEVQTRVVTLWSVDVDLYPSPGSLETAIRERSSRERLLKIELKGSPTLELLDFLEGLEDRFRDRFGYLRVEHDGVEVVKDLVLDSGYVVGRFARKLLDRIEKAEDPEEKRILRMALNFGVQALRGAGEP